MTQANVKCIETRRGKIPYLESGEGPKTVVFLHGFLGSPIFSEATGAMLKKKGIRFIAPYLPGHGPSYRLPQGFLFLDLVSEMEAFITALGATPVAIIGHSLGGAVAWEIGQRQRVPIKKIMLVNPGLGKFTPLLPKAWHWFKGRVFIDAESLSGLREGEQDFASPHFSSALQLLRMVLSTKVTEKKFNSSVRIVILWGSKDWLTPFATYEKMIADFAKGAKVKVFPGAHHWFMWQKDTYLEEINNFV